MEVGGHAVVGDANHVAREFVAVLDEERAEARAADFLLALDEEDDVHGRRAGAGERLADAEDVREDLAFVVRRAPGVDAAVAERGFEGRRDPLIKRIGRLDIVMAVDEDGAFRRIVRRAGEDDGVPGGGADLGVEAEGLQEIREPAGASGEGPRRVRLAWKSSGNGEISGAGSRGRLA